MVRPWPGFLRVVGHLPLPYFADFLIMRRPDSIEAEFTQDRRGCVLLRKGLGQDADAAVGVLCQPDKQAGHPGRNALAFVSGECEVGDLDPPCLGRGLEGAGANHLTLLQCQIADPRAYEPGVPIRCGGCLADRAGHIGQRQVLDRASIHSDFNQTNGHRFFLLKQSPF